MKLKNHLTTLLLTTLLILIPLTPASATPLDEVKALLEYYYVAEVPAAALSATTIEKTIKNLGDEHTKYWTKQEFEEFADYMDPHFAGLGIYIEAVPEGMQVIGIIDNTPAQHAGLKEQDIILSVNNTPLSGKTVEEGQENLLGTPGSKAKLQIKRGDTKLEYTLTRAIVDVPTVTGEIFDRHIGYIDINTFGTNTLSEFDQLIRSLDEKADVWIIDLRDNTGGYFNTALSLAGYFIGDKTALYMEEQGDFTPYHAFKQTLLIEEPVYILVNNHSASSSEILAAALKDHKQALLVGEKTYGKGSVQSIFELSNGDYLKLTVAHFHSPNRTKINQVGITPDIPAPSDKTLKRTRMLIGSKE